MTVAKLIKMLQNMPQDAIVYVENGTTEDDIDRYTCYSKVSTSMKLRKNGEIPCLLLGNDDKKVRDYQFENYNRERSEHVLFNRI